MKTVNLIILALVIVAIGIFAFYRFGSDEQAVTPGADIKTRSMAELVQHATPTDCWLAIEGKVYDVTPLIASGKHPGGETILQGCGLDATELFNTRPMGSKTPHSQAARGMLANFYIGDLER